MRTRTENFGELKPKNYFLNYFFSSKNEMSFYLEKSFRQEIYRTYFGSEIGRRFWDALSAPEREVENLIRISRTL